LILLTLTAFAVDSEEIILKPIGKQVPDKPLDAGDVLHGYG
jgi:hypothetical protein